MLEMNMNPAILSKRHGSKRKTTFCPLKMFLYGFKLHSNNHAEMAQSAKQQSCYLAYTSRQRI